MDVPPPSTNPKSVSDDVRVIYTNLKFMCVYLLTNNHMLIDQILRGFYLVPVHNRLASNGSITWMREAAIQPGTQLRADF